MLKTFESSSEIDLIEDPRYGRLDRGGCVNVLTPRRPQVKGTEGMGSNSCLVQIERWTPADKQRTTTENARQSAASEEVER